MERPRCSRTPQTRILDRLPHASPPSLAYRGRRFAEKMLAEFASYGAWVTGEEDCEEYGACRCDGRIVLLSDPKKDITDLVARDLAPEYIWGGGFSLEHFGRTRHDSGTSRCHSMSGAFQHVRDICVTSCAAWHSCALRLLERQPGPRALGNAQRRDTEIFVLSSCCSMPLCLTCVVRVFNSKMPRAKRMRSDAFRPLRTFSSSPNVPSAANACSQPYRSSPHVSNGDSCDAIQGRLELLHNQMMTGILTPQSVNGLHHISGFVTLQIFYLSTC